MPIFSTFPPHMETIFADARVRADMENIKITFVNKLKVCADRVNIEFHFAEIQQVAQWATIAHLGASIMFGKSIIYDAQWQVALT